MRSFRRSTWGGARTAEHPRRHASAESRSLRHPTVPFRTAPSFAAVPLPRRYIHLSRVLPETRFPVIALPAPCSDEDEPPRSLGRDLPFPLELSEEFTCCGRIGRAQARQSARLPRAMLTKVRIHGRGSECRGRENVERVVRREKNEVDGRCRKPEVKIRSGRGCERNRSTKEGFEGRKRHAEREETVSTAKERMERRMHVAEKQHKEEDADRMRKDRGAPRRNCKRTSVQGMGR